MLFVLYFIFNSAYAVFSYIFTDVNLVLSTNSVYWNFQRRMWQWNTDSQLLTTIYVSLIVGLFLLYLRFLYSNYKRKVESSDIFWYLLLLVPLLLSYNALSHDVFNYMFNSKMVLEFGANPHIQTALDFAGDEWVRFMHNVHTPAPYGYGWTALSLIPGFLGFQKLIPTLLAFRLLNLVGLALLYYALQHLSQTIYKKDLTLQQLGVLYLNPLFMIEIISNYHNDIWMLIPAVYGLSFLLRMFRFSSNETGQKIKYFVIASGLLAISVSIKLATLVLLPIFILLFILIIFSDQISKIIQRKIAIPVPQFIISQGISWISQYVERFVPLVVAFLLFIPLLTARSQQFHPWYWTWVLVWIPFIHNRVIRNTIIIFSITSLLRYVPWIYNSFEYSDEILRNQKLVTWLVPLLYLFTNLRKTLVRPLKR